MKSAMPFKGPNKQVYIFLFLPKVDVTRTLVIDGTELRMLSLLLDNEMKPQKPAGEAAKFSHDPINTHAAPQQGYNHHSPSKKMISCTTLIIYSEIPRNQYKFSCSNTRIIIKPECVSTLQ